MPHLLSVGRGRKPIASDAWLVGVLRTIIEVAVLVMLHTGQDLAHSHTIARQFVGDDDPRVYLKPLSNLRKNVFSDLTNMSMTFPS